MQHSFNVEIAKEYGILEAILLENINYWLLKNEANEKNYHDGNYWTYNSTRAFATLFPYASQRQIQTALKKLINEGILITGNYNEYAYDRTLWYALTEKGKCIMRKCKMDDTEKGNGFTQDVKPIPNINTNINTNNKPDNNKGKTTHKSSKFVAPTVEEVKSYCEERNNGIDAQRFVDYYQARGWMIGKNHIKDWKACVRTWERNTGYNQKPNDQYKPNVQEQSQDTSDFDECINEDGSFDIEKYINNFYEE